MAITIKNAEQIKRMEEASYVVMEAHKLIESLIQPGITTRELDRQAEVLIRKHGAAPSFLNYHGYPASICVSVNEVVIHGIPGLKKLKSGDIVSIDIGAVKNGYHSDAARTHACGTISDEDRQLIDVTRQSFFEGIKYAVEGRNLHDISAAIEAYVTPFGYSVVRDFVGHGIGTKMHEEPQIPHYKMKNRGPRLVKGMALAIEPMVNAGTYNVKILQDDWTVVTMDKKKSAHYENTIIVTESEPVILTLY